MYFRLAVISIFREIRVSGRIESTSILYCTVEPCGYVVGQNAKSIDIYGPFFRRRMLGGSYTKRRLLLSCVTFLNG
jgi:hypothetical protein